MTELNAYLDLLYHMLYKPRAKAMRRCMMGDER
jgi:hypothetical protein